MNTVITKIFDEPKFDKKEILKYLGVKEENETLNALVSECLNECSNVFSYKISYSLFEIEIKDGIITFPFATVKSELLAKHLGNSRYAVVFAGTVGMNIDRIISKYSVIAPSKAVIFQAIGTERIEALCDEFCDELSREYKDVKSRFSPGYGDLPLDMQKDIINVLSTAKNIGLTLNSGMLMSPTKSVTAIVGIK